ncbi:hypothetical protein ACEPAI_4128 [Sanghuangporus weigelae]
MASTDLSKSKYAERSRQLMETARKLRDIGAQALFDIPRIAVIGGQSAGKSSLVEAVSGIRVPRDSGTCTRCPMEVNMICQPGQWECKIFLRFEYDASGAAASEVQKVSFGSALTSVDDVELALRRAQAAILNYPKEVSDLFLMKTRDELEYYRKPEAFKNGTLKFSKNIVVVDIFDPDCGNLSFVDLPGLIQNDEQEVVRLVEDLVMSNIQGNCLILVTIPMSDDMENQRAMRLALDADKDRSRTIGVLTKPDTLTSGAIGARKKWKDLITGGDTPGAYALKHGYYCVKLLDDAERACNPSRLERNESENTFFSNTTPWSIVPDRKQFGVSNLVTDLSKLLTAILDQKLPELRKQAQEELIKTLAALGQLPAPLLADTPSEVLERVTNFCQEFSGTIYGTINAMMPELQSSGHAKCCGKSFIHRNRAIYEEFKHQIRSTAPDFRPFGDHEEHNKPHFTDSEQYYSKEGVGNGPRDLTYVRRVIKESKTWELPNNVPFDAKHALIDEFTREWDTPTIRCFEKAFQNLTTCLNHILHRHFDRFRKLNSHMSDLVKDIVDGHKQIANPFILAPLKQEKHPLYTQNEHYFTTLRLYWLAEYTEARLRQYNYLKSKPPTPPGIFVVRFCESIFMLLSEIYDDESYGSRCSVTLRSVSATPPLLRACSPPRAYSPPPPRAYFPPKVVPARSALEITMDRALAALRELGYKNVTRADLPRLMMAPDEFSEELTVMADVRAYFFIAYKRIIDNVPLAIEHALNQGLAEVMKKTLLQKLNLGAADAAKRLKELMEEDPDIALEREALKNKIEKLEEIEAELRLLLA